MVCSLQTCFKRKRRGHIEDTWTEVSFWIYLHCLFDCFFFFFFFFWFLVGQYDHRQGLKHQAVRHIDFNFFANAQHTTKEGLQERNIRDCIFEGWFTKTGCGSKRAVNLSIMDTSNSHRRFPSSTDNSAFGTTTLRP